MDLPLDVKTVIARSSVSAWISLGADPEFGRFAISDAGRAMFSATFTTTVRTSLAVFHTINGRRHRVGGPAVVIADRSKWYVHADFSVETGPQLVYSNGRVTWGQHIQHDDSCGCILLYYERGQLHRVDGPAHCSTWYFRGKKHRVGGPAEADNYGEKWFEHGRLHRADGPALSNRRADKWFWHGQLHRVGGPAVEHYAYNKWYYYGREYDPADMPTVDTGPPRRNRPPYKHLARQRRAQS